MGYPNSERETTCVFDYETGKWTVYSCVPVHMNKLNKIAEPFWTEEEDGRIVAAKWTLDYKQVRFAALSTRHVSEEQRQAAGERLRALHEQRKLQASILS